MPVMLRLESGTQRAPSSRALERRRKGERVKEARQLVGGRSILNTRLRGMSLSQNASMLYIR